MDKFSGLVTPIFCRVNDVSFEVSEEQFVGARGIYLRDLLKSNFFQEVTYRGDFEMGL